MTNIFVDKSKNVLLTLLFAVPNQDEDDEKKETGPVKTSDEILMELFQVFNAAPPDVLTSRSGKKKHKKHKKKSKKSKKRDSKSDLSEISSDPEGDGAEKESKRKHKSKIKKERDVDGARKSSSSNSRIKKEKRSRSRSPSSRKSHGEVKANKDSKNGEAVDKREEKSLVRYSFAETIGNSKSTTSSFQSNKIVIKDLRNSVVLAEANSSSNGRKRRHRRSSSSLSLSDEETYEKEKQTRQERRRRSPSSRPKDNFRSSYRESRRGLR